MAHKQFLAGIALAMAVATAPSMAKAGVTITAGNSAGTGSWTGSSVTGPTTILSDSAGSSTLTLLSVDPDPGFTTGNFFQDFGPYNASAALDSFNFVAVDPITPLIDGQAYAVTATLAITETANPGLGQVVILADAAGNSNLMLNNIGGCAAGVDLGGAGLGATAGSTSASYSATSTFIASAGCDSSLIADFTFQGNGGGNTYSLTESLTVAPIPEPMSAVVLGVGAIAVLSGNRRRKVC